MYMLDPGINLPVNSKNTTNFSTPIKVKVHMVHVHVYVHPKTTNSVTMAQTSITLRSHERVDK